MNKSSCLKTVFALLLLTATCLMLSLSDSIAASDDENRAKVLKETDSNASARHYLWLKLMSWGWKNIDVKWGESSDSHNSECSNRVGNLVPCDSAAAVEKRNYITRTRTTQIRNNSKVPFSCTAYFEWRRRTQYGVATKKMTKKGVWETFSDSDTYDVNDFLGGGVKNTATCWVPLDSATKIIGLSTEQIRALLPVAKQGEKINGVTYFFNPFKVVIGDASNDPVDGPWNNNPMEETQLPPGGIALTGTLNVCGTPEGARLEITGPDDFSKTEMLPAKFDGLKSGVYLLKTSQEGYIPDENKVTVQPGVTSTVTIEMLQEMWTDKDSRLTWQVVPSEKTMPWSEADSYCNNLSLGGYSDWRLPNIIEFQTLIKGCSNTKAGGICDTVRGGFWSSSVENEIQKLIEYKSGTGYGDVLLSIPGIGDQPFLDVSGLSGPAFRKRLIELMINTCPDDDACRSSRRLVINFNFIERHRTNAEATLTIEMGSQDVGWNKVEVIYLDSPDTKTWAKNVLTAIEKALTAKARKSEKQYSAYKIDLGKGSKEYLSTGYSYMARCVSGEAVSVSAETPKPVISKIPKQNIQGVWIDPDTGYWWQNPPAPEKMNWDNGMNYCESLSLGGQSDWRLPDHKLFKSIVAENEVGGCYWKNGLTGNCDSWYLIDTPELKGDSREPYQEVFNFGGYKNFGNKNYTPSYIRCVRGGQ